jgi:Protein of unknown function (DUF3108)
MKHHAVALCALLVLVRFDGEPVQHEGGDLSGTMFPPINTVMQEGEDLVYEVRWTWFKLGTVRIKAGPDFTARAFINSYSNIPFVDLHVVQFTSMDSMFLSRASHSAEKVDTAWVVQRYVTDKTQDRLFVEKTFAKQYNAPPYREEWVDTIKLDGKQFIDGLSIGYFPRLFIHTVQHIDVPTILNGKIGTTEFRYTRDRTAIDIDALDEPVRSIKVEGTTTVEGIYGMTGEFTGWFSDDSAAVPVKGRLKVLIGNVTIELIAWKRDGWTPPLLR